MRVMRTIALALAVLAGTAVIAAAASSPSVKTGAATNIKNTSAVLNGTVNPNGAATKYWFEWGLTTSYGSTSAVHSLSAGTVPVAVSLTASKLNPGTKYHFRLFAQNKFGTTSGADHTFTTKGHPLPVAQTGPALGISQTSATITGTVVPNGQSTPWRFVWGTSPTSLIFTVMGGTVPATTPLQPVSAPLTGLAPGTTFYYQVQVNRSGFGWLPSNTLAFTTIPTARPYPSVRAATRPHRDRQKPFMFATTGSVVSSSFPPFAECTGRVAIRYFAAGHRVALRYATVQPNCTFAHVATFKHTFSAHRGGRRPAVQTVRIEIRFAGNAYLAPRKARTEFVVLG